MLLPHLEVPPLSEVDGRELLEHVAGPVGVGIAERLIAATQGNPFALLAFVAELSGEQLLGDLPLPEPLPVGRTLQDQFAARAVAPGGRAHRPAAGRRGALRGPGAPAARGSSARRTLGGRRREHRGGRSRQLCSRCLVSPSADPLGGVPRPSTSSDCRRAHRALGGGARRRRRHRPAGVALRGRRDRPGRGDRAPALAASAGRVFERGGSAAAAELLQRASELTPDPEQRIDRLLQAVPVRALRVVMQHRRSACSTASCCGPSVAVCVRKRSGPKVSSGWTRAGRVMRCGLLQRAVASIETVRSRPSARRPHHRGGSHPLRSIAGRRLPCRRTRGEGAQLALRRGSVAHRGRTTRARDRDCGHRRLRARCAHPARLRSHTSARTSRIRCCGDGECS